MARAPVPAGLRARPHRARPVRRVAGGPGACGGRCRSSTGSRSARRRGSSRPRRTSPGGSSARPGSSRRCCRTRRRSSTTAATGHGDFVLSVNRLDRAKRIDLLLEAAALERVAARSSSPATGPTVTRLEAARARPRRSTARVRFAGRVSSRGAGRPLRHVLRRLLRAGRRGLRDGPVRVVPLREARDHDDRRRRPARDRARRLDRARRRARGRGGRRGGRRGCATTRTRRRRSGARARRSPPRSRGTARSGGCSS